MTKRRYLSNSSGSKRDEMFFKQSSLQRSSKEKESRICSKINKRLKYLAVGGSTLGRFVNQVVRINESLLLLKGDTLTT